MTCFWGHKWSEQSRHYNRPELENFEGTTSKDAMLKMAYGTTTIILRCRVCGNLKSQNVVGDARECSK